MEQSKVFAGGDSQHKVLAIGRSKVLSPATFAIEKWPERENSTVQTEKVSTEQSNSCDRKKDDEIESAQGKNIFRTPSQPKPPENGCVRDVKLALCS
jgi:hypothetical protein